MGLMCRSDASEVSDVSSGRLRGIFKQVASSVGVQGHCVGIEGSDEGLLKESGGGGWLRCLQ